MEIEIVTDLAVGLDDLLDTPGSRLVLLMDGRGGNQALDLELVGVSEKANHGHSIVRLVLDIGENEDAGLFCGTDGFGRVQPLFLPRIVGFDHLFAPTAVPTIAVSSLGFKVVKAILPNAVPITEERAIGLDLIEPRP